MTSVANFSCYSLSPPYSRDDYCLFQCYSEVFCLFFKTSWILELEKHGQVELRRMSCRSRHGWGCSSIGISRKSVLAFMWQIMLEFHITGSWITFCQDWTKLHGRFRLMIQSVENGAISLGAKDTLSASQVEYWGQTVLGNVYLEAGVIPVILFSNRCLALDALCAYYVVLLFHLLCFANDSQAFQWCHSIWFWSL